MYGRSSPLRRGRGRDCAQTPRALGRRRERLTPRYSPRLVQCACSKHIIDLSSLCLVRNGHTEEQFDVRYRLLIGRFSTLFPTIFHAVMNWEDLTIQGVK